MNCIIKGCVSSAQLLNFPRNNAQCQQWLDQLRNPNMVKSDPRIIRKYFRMCADHFESQYFEQINVTPLKLVSHAIPTLNLHPENEPSESITDPEIIEAGNYYMNHFTNLYKKYKLLYSPNMHQVFTKAMSKMSAINRVCLLQFQFLPLRTRQEGKLTVSEVHALVFMVRGIYENWKQLLTYVFIETCTSIEVYAAYVCDAIHTALSLFFDVIAVVCAPDKTNIEIMDLLKDKYETYPQQKFEYIPFKNQDIMILYDPPFLLNKLFSDFKLMDVKFSLNYKKYIASWDDIKNFHTYSKDHDCQILSENHVSSTELHNSVEICAQVFSNTLGENLLIHALNSSPEERSSYEGTGKFVKFINKLFDSVNGYTSRAPAHKPLYCKVNRNTKHFESWEYFAEVVENMMFLHPFMIDQRETSTLSKLCTTLHGLKHMWGDLVFRGFREFAPRRLNLDALENDIARIRFLCCIDDIRQDAKAKVFFYPSGSEFILGFRHIFENGTNFLQPLYTTFLNPLHFDRNDLCFECNNDPNELPRFEDNSSSIITKSSFERGTGYERITYFTIDRRPELRGCFVNISRESDSFSH